MPPLPTGTVTFLFTDIEASTRLLGQLRDRYAEVLAEHRSLLRTAFAETGGAEVDTQGDAFFVAFSRAKDAMLAAVVAQRALHRHAWPSGTAVRVRMGIHTGEPLLTETGYVGMDVHRAARISQASHGAQILLSQTTRDLISADLPDGISLLDLGEHRLKDMSEPQRLFQVVAPELPAEFPPIWSLGTIPNNLPRQLTSFVGRAHEVEEIERLLSQTYVLTLAGAGGCGKTRLAAHVAGQ
ncbi:MAG TPA: adenylate/guanylate cyclase domain-containing protein, partial [bacterium]|nr:adenylate/guanylate cyclase domain-containing protein [bacterium]